MSPKDWNWLWLGDGELRNTLDRSGRIAVSGWLPRSDALDLLSGSDVMVHTSSWEGMPIAILESMALKVPVVATDIPGNRDLIVPGETGFLAGDAASFLAALTTLASLNDLRRRMGDAGRSRVVQEFDFAKLGSRWIELYARLVGEKIAMPAKNHGSLTP